VSKGHDRTIVLRKANLGYSGENAAVGQFDQRFFKKIDNSRYSVAIHFMHYNFRHVRKTLRVTTAMEAGVAAHVRTRTLEEVVSLLNKAEKIAA
jgi:hypothetical protein